MVDFDGGKRGGFERDGGAEESLGLGSNNYQDAPASASAGTRTVVPDANGVVVLPAGVSLDDLSVQGRDLVITLEDGSRIIIPDGAIIVPQLVIDGVAVPPLNVAALLNDALTPAGEPGQLPSSGGEFDDGEAFLQDAFDLGDLLPYTELPLGVVEEEEIIPAQDSDPDIVIETPDNPIGVENAIAKVAERGLPERGEPSEPAGTADETNAETTTGTIIFSAPDGLSAIILNGVPITTVGQQYVTPFGTLTITSINLASGEIGFSYTLADNLLGETEDGNFFVTVVDTDGDTADATLKIIVEDDSPIAADDIGIVPAGTHAPITGDVLLNDESGADDYREGEEGELDAVTVFSSVSTGDSADAGGQVVGQYGTLTINPDGTYTYVRAYNTPGGVSESFTYTIIDQDGSTDTATLVINIEDSPDSIGPEIGEGTEVREAHLPPTTDTRDDEAPGSAFDGNSETTTGTITFHSPDGVQSVTIEGVAIDPNNLPQAIFADATGTLVITGYAYDPVTGDGSITYAYTLNDNTSGDDTNATFEVVVTDLDGDVAADDLVITIIDDVPDAIDDFATQENENDPVTVDVFGNDVPGADDVAFDKIAYVADSLTGAGTLVNNGDGTFTYTPAPGEEGDADGKVYFQYSITDGDGDTDIATVEITLLPDSVPEIGAEGANVVDEAGLAARGDEPAGSDEPSDSEFTQGGIFIFTGNDTVASLVINGVDVTEGGTVTTSKGVLTVVLDNGQYSYTYELTDNTLSDPDSDTFSLVVTDSDGDTANTSIVIAILDDSPSADDDSNSIASGEYGPIGGNVLDNDTQGADGAVVTSYTGAGGSGDAGDEIQGAWGKLTINPDGSYTYTRDPGTPGGQIDTFTYTITDGDGDPANAQLVITIGDSTTTLDLPTEGEDGTLVDEAGLDGPPNGADVGTDAGSDSETTAGTFTYTAPDGPATVLIDGVEVTSVGQTFTGTFGTLTITAINPGSISYSYELTTNTSGDTTFDEFVVRVEDQDDDFSQDTLRIDIVDDEPLAGDNEPVALDDDALGGNPGGDGDASPDSANLTGTLAHQFGADGAGSITFASMDGETVDINGVTVTFSWSGDTLTANDGANDVFTVQVNATTGEYTVTQLAPLNHHVNGDDVETDASFVLTYTVTDGDTDAATGTLTINLNDDTPEFGEAEGSAPTLVTDDTNTVGGTDSDSGSFAGLFAPLFGADGAASTDPITYALSLKDGDGTDSGLTDAQTDARILLRLNGDVVEAYLEGSPSTIAFTLTLNPETGEITQEQLRAIEHDNPNDPIETGVEAEGMAADLISLTATITDGDGDQAEQTIDIGDSFTFEDDTAAATDNAKTVTEGASVSGDVILDNNGYGTDTPGADGYAADGPVVDADFVSADQGVTFTSKTVAPDGTITIVTSAGTLTLDPDGSYTFAADANSINANAEIVFSYTIEDGDGDQSTANLTIDLTNVAGSVSDDDVDVDEKGLSNGTGELADPAPESDQSEIDADGKITVNGASGTFKFILVGGVFDDGGTVGDTSDDTYTIDGTYGTIVLNASTGEYTYTLDTRFDHDPAADRNVALDAENFDYRVEDSLGNEIGTGTIEVNITDDIPEVDIATTGQVPDPMLTYDADTVGGTSTDTADFSNAFDYASFQYGADGAGTLVTTYALVLNTGGVTTLSSDGNPVYLYQLANGTIIGSTSNVAPVAVDANTVFTISVVANTGVVTLTQYAELDHSDSDTAPAYDGDTIPLPAGLVSIEATATITDADLDVVTDKASIDLGDYVNFADDGPNASISAAGVSVSHDETPGNDGDADDTSDAAIAALFAGVFNPGDDANVAGTGAIGYAVSENGLSSTGSDYGADGEGTTVFSLDVSSVGVDSGLDTTEGASIYLYKEGDLIVGRVGDANGEAAFAIAVDADSGEISVAQYLSISHPTGGASHDESVSIANGALLGVVTVTDEEGDSDTANVAIGNLVSFQDDGPSVTANPNGATVDLDESATSSVAALISTGIYTKGDDTDVPGTGYIAKDTSDQSMVSWVEQPGADGKLGSVSFALDVTNDGTSGLFTTGGVAIVLVEVSPTVVVGVISGTTTAAFAIEINPANGFVTVEQYMSLYHSDDADPNDVVDLADGSLGVVVTLTDGDGDTAQSTADISANINFADDAPSLVASTTQPVLTVDETVLGTDASASFAGVFTPTYGADGAGSVSGFVLGVSGANAVSGLVDTATGLNVVLNLVGGQVVGTAGVGGPVVFVVSVDAGGTVTLDQQRAVVHSPDTGPDQSTGLSADNLITLTATVTDADGDTSTATADIGQNLVFKDDAPSLVASTTQPVLTVDETVLGTDASASFASVFTPTYGADGAGSVSGFVLGVSGANAVSGLVDTATGLNVVLNLVGGQVVGTAGVGGPVVFVVSVDAGGTVTLDQQRAVVHSPDTGPDQSTGLSADNLITLTATVTDADGDTSTATADIGQNLVFKDDAPSLDNVQDGTASNDPSALHSFGSLNFLSGADGAGDDADIAISVDLTGITSGGATINQVTVNGVLYAYTGTGTFVDGVPTTGLVFTLEVDTATDQWDFDLIAPLDGEITPIEIGSGSSFGVGPSGSVVVTDDVTSTDLVFVTGWVPTSGWTGTEESDWLSGDMPTMTQQFNVNGSTQGWGLANNNFDAGEFLRFDFGTLDDYDDPAEYGDVGPDGSYNPPPDQTIVAAEYATFSFFGFTTGEKIEFVAHYTDGTTETFVFTSATDPRLTAVGNDLIFTITSPLGAQIEWVDTYMAIGSIKLNLIEVGVRSEDVDTDLNFTVTIPDGDGDTDTDSFTINLADGNPPSVVPPVVLNLEGDAEVFVGLDAGLAYDYNGDGVKTQTAWIAAGSAILVHDGNSNGIVDGASEFVFGGNGMTDLEAIAAKYDENGDNVLDANDAAYGKFGVWIDDGDAVFEAGEFQTLEQAGIKSIDLNTNGVGGSEVGGDVYVHNTVAFTMDDGTEGTAYDASFALGSDVDGTMEALLSLAPETTDDVSLAQVAGLGESGVAVKVVDIMDDIMAGQAVDSVIDHFAGSTNEFVGLANENGYLGHDALAAMIETGAFAFDNGIAADMTEEAAALATMHA
ncbi:DUF5801 repeats-in-toxin domain-containing protein [Altererythrobacter sp. Z27]|uniref:DUF5801 repeats-in-toxin domain-containing protein n=1 Tax=Altererythrobacter sp. Z27 TaxID=3461147 RepID=UPI004043C89B